MDDDDAKSMRSVAQELDPAAQACLPPLRIHHLIVWTAVLAIVLSLFNGMRLQHEQEPTWQVAVTVIQFVLASAALTSLGFGIAWRLSGKSVPNEPGHWMIIETALASVLFATIAVLVRAYRPPADEMWIVTRFPGWIQAFLRWSSPIGGALLGMLNIAIACRLVAGWKWKTVFWLAAWVCIVTAGMQAFFFVFVELIPRANVAQTLRWINLVIDAVPTLMIVLLLVSVSVSECKTKLVRHWSHWVGVAGWGIHDSVKIARYCAAYLLGEF